MGSAYKLFCRSKMIRFIWLLVASLLLLSSSFEGFAGVDALCEQFAPDDCYSLDVTQAWNGNGDFALKVVWQRNPVTNVWTLKDIPNVVRATAYTETLFDGTINTIAGLPANYVTKNSFYAMVSQLIYALQK